MFDASNQFWVFLACIFLGGCVFFVYKITHFFPFAKKWQIAVADGLFCLFSFVAVCFGLLYICYGSLRWFCFLGIALGFWLAAKTVGFYIDILTFKLYNFFIKNLNKIKSNVNKRKGND